jgi:hypothetical protein
LVNPVNWQRENDVLDHLKEVLTVAVLNHVNDGVLHKHLRAQTMGVNMSKVRGNVIYTKPVMLLTGTLMIMQLCVRRGLLLDICV